MFEQLLKPQPKFRYFTEPVMVDFPYDRLEKGPFSPPAEWAVAFNIKGEVQSALVPSFSVDEESQTVRASLIGKNDKRILVGFAPTQLGSRSFFIDEHALVEKIPSLDEYN